MSRAWKASLTALGGVILVIMAVKFWPSSPRMSARSSGDSTSPVPVTVVPAKTQTIPVLATAIGTVMAMNTVRVNPQISGQLLELCFKEGQSVKKGDLLAKIDSRALQASVDQAAATFQQNQAQLANARNTYQRSSDPAYQPYVSRVDLDTQRHQVLQYEAAAAANAAAMRSAQVQLQYTLIRAPVDGIAGIRGVDVGNIVSTSSTIVTITQVQPIYIAFTLPENLLTAVRRAQASGPVTVQVLNREDTNATSLTGQLDVINNQIDTDSGTFSVRAIFENRDNALWPGQFMNVQVLLRSISNGVVIPVQAVQRGSDGEFVYLLQPDHTVTVRSVKQGVAVDDSLVQITQGLQAGDTVVTEGQFRLKDHTLVTPLAPGQTPSLQNTAKEAIFSPKGQTRHSMGPRPH